MTREHERYVSILRELHVPAPAPDFFDRLTARLEEEVMSQVEERTNIERRAPRWAVAVAAVALVATAIGIGLARANSGSQVPIVSDPATEDGPVDHSTEDDAAPRPDLDLSEIEGVWYGQNEASQHRAGRFIEVEISGGTAPAQSQVATAIYRNTEDGAAWCTARWLSLEAAPPSYRVSERTDDTDRCPNGRIELRYDAATDTLGYETVGSGIVATLERADGS